MNTFLAAAGLTATPITHSGDVELLRQIRNTCRATFSHDTREITEQEQERWWLHHQRRLVAFLYREIRVAGGEVVGYGLLRREDDGRWWDSVAVLPGYRGRGYGRAITAHLARSCPAGVAWAQARTDNPAADRMHDRRDWEVIAADDRLRTYRTKEGLS